MRINDFIYIHRWRTMAVSDVDVYLSNWTKLLLLLCCIEIFVQKS